MKPWSEFVPSLRGKHIHVVGLSATECTAFLQVVAVDPDVKITVHDFSIDEEEMRRGFMTTHVALPKAEREALFAQLTERFPKRHLRANYLDGIETADLLYIPQSWDLYPQNAPIEGFMEEKPDQVLTLMDLYLRYLPCTVIGVTGTNGKTTVSSMLADMAEKAGKHVVVSGNHRYHAQLLPVLDQVPTDAIAVLEISHKHLARLTEGPQIAVLTNVAGDHLDQFASFDEYAARKKRLIEQMAPGGAAILNWDDGICQEVQVPANTQVYRVHTQPQAPTGPHIHVGPERLHGELGGDTWQGARAEIRIPGEHNAINGALALCALHAAGVPPQRAFEALQTCRGVKHRLEFLRNIQEVAIYDDTAATSPAATHAAISALLERHASVHVLVGGDAKGNEYSTLKELVRDPRVHLIGLGGSAAETLCDSNSTRAKSLKEGIQRALEYSKKEDAVLVSPAGAGFHTAHSEGKGPGLRALVRRWGR